MKLIPSQNTQEIELILNNGLGFNVTVMYKDNNILVDYLNTTEVHWLYNYKTIAIESTVHGTGVTIDIDNIKYIDIQAATQLSDSF